MTRPLQPALALIVLASTTAHLLIDTLTDHKLLDRGTEGIPNTSDDDQDRSSEDTRSSTPFIAKVLSREPKDDTGEEDTSSDKP
jgi:hypothetical protein